MSNMYTYQPPCDKATLERLYVQEGHTQHEVAKILGTSQKVVWRALQRYSIPARPAIKRNQRGPQNTSWKGDKATYQALHLRVATARGKPMKCEVCGTSDPNRSYDWANMTKQYADVNDYKRMCRSCHHRHDGKINNIHKMRKGGDAL